MAERLGLLAVRVRARPEEELSGWLQALQSGLAELRRYEHTPLPEVLGWSEVGRGRPLFESIVVFEGFTSESAFQADLGGVYLKRGGP